MGDTTPAQPVSYIANPSTSLKVFTVQDFKAWLNTNANWVKSHREVLYLYCNSVHVYILNSQINVSCRADDPNTFNSPTVHILNAFRIAPPLPTDLIVHRIIFALPSVAIGRYKVGDVITETAPTSTTLVPSIYPQSLLF